MKSQSRTSTEMTEMEPPDGSTSQRAKSLNYQGLSLAEQITADAGVGLPGGRAA
jgi:hypothetical protein